MLCFIDETGDHNLTKVDKQYPVFGLGALYISEEEFALLDSKINALKKEFFGGSDFILHSAELKRPGHKKSDGRNGVATDPVVRANLYSRIDTIIEETDLGFFSCFVNKEMLTSYYTLPVDPYHFSFENLLNRILWKAAEPVKIFAESRSKDLDTALLAEYTRLCTVGTRFHDAETLNHMTSLECILKSANNNGLQIIDLALLALSRHYMSKTHKMVGNDVSPTMLEQKYLHPPTFFPRKRT